MQRSMSLMSSQQDFAEKIIAENRSPLSKVPTEIRILLTFASSVVFFSVAGVSLTYFLQAKWFTDPGPYAMAWEGYDVAQFVALLSVISCGPVGMVLLLVSMQQTLRACPRHLLPVASLVFVGLLGAGAVIGGQAAKDPLLDCFFVGCTNNGEVCTLTRVSDNKSNSRDNRFW